MRRALPILLFMLALPACAKAHDPTRLPVGDGKISSSPKRGSVYRCGSAPGGGPGGGPPGASRQGPWFNGDGTWDLTKKASVDGAKTWANAIFSVQVSGTSRVLRGNGLPTRGTTGTFPVATTDDAYQYDRNPNAIRAQTVRASIPARPAKAASPECLTGGPIGYLTNGVAIFDALDAGGRDALAWEVQDTCDGHPQMSGMYHYHAISRCLTTFKAGSSHSGRMGWALDGFAIYGPRGSGGKLLTNGALDACHGHTHRIRGRRAYHYHATLEFPYTLACFRGRTG
jgi:hypothetical protein